MSFDSSPFDYEDKKSFPPPLPRYKVWNNSVKEPVAIPTPGIVMSTRKKIGDTKPATYETTTALVDKIEAVILFGTPSRTNSVQKDGKFKITCQAHDGIHPSARIAKPLCRSLTAGDLSTILLGWKGAEHAKVTAQVAELTNNTGFLQVCGMKGSSDVIPLCPFAKTSKDADGNILRKASCKKQLHIGAWDLTHNREFSMDLTGLSLESREFIAPIHEFFKLTRKFNAPDGSPASCFMFKVVLSLAPKEKFFYLNVTDIKPITDAAEIEKFKQLSDKARDNYERESVFVPNANPTNVSPPGVVSVQAPAIGQSVVSAPPVTAAMPAHLKQEVTFDDEDDINF